MKSHAIAKAGVYPDSGPRTTAENDHERFVDDYLPALLAQAHHLVSGEFHAVANAHGFTPAEWRVFATLASGQPMSIGRLATISVMKQPTLTRLLDRMEAAGQVKRL